MKWIRLDAPPGSIILNTGDYMQRITQRHAALHHAPREPAARSRAAPAAPRVSFPMAVYVWEDEVLEVLPGLGPAKYEPIKAIQFHTRITSKYYGDDYAVGRGLARAPAAAPSLARRRLSREQRRSAAAVLRGLLPAAPRAAAAT